VLTLDTVIHANGSKDVYIFGIQNRTYVAEHDTYSSSGVLMAKSQTLIDGTTDQKTYSGNFLVSEVLT
jgi:hypothetical protein